MVDTLLCFFAISEPIYKHPQQHPRETAIISAVVSVRPVLVANGTRIVAVAFAKIVAFIKKASVTN